ncbi:MAG: hypothetical protein ACJAS2_002553 [Pseudohongiellaceae bacterium]|jgi:uncharacterized protein YaiL (DUF2058 family)
MGNSLQDQLKNSGLIDDKKAKQLKRAKSKEEKVARKASGKGLAVDERKLELDRKKAEQVEKDRKLNQEKNAKQQHKAVNAQIKQLIQKNSIVLGAEGKGGDKKYSFADGGKIKHLWISQLQVSQLSQGQIAIVRSLDKAVLVPLIVAEKIAQRDPSAILFKAEKNVTLAADDPYADYKIPDDLDW